MIDLIVLLLLGLGFLLGWHHGFFKTGCKIASFFIAWLAGMLLSGIISGQLVNNQQLSNQLLYFTAGAEKLSDMSVANTDVALLSVDKIKEIISTSGLSPSIAGHIQYNIINQVFFDRGIVTMSDYYNQTIIILSINLLSFFIVYAAVRILANVGMEVFDRLRPFPALKQHDRLYGGLLGILQGAMICFVLFSILPILFSMLPLESVNAMIDRSLLGKLFYHLNIITNVLAGR